MSEKILVISKAGPIADQQIDDVKIVITGCPPNFADLKEQGLFYDNDAEDLAEKLINSLPGGTLDRLTAKLLMHKASLFRVLGN